MTTNLPSPDPQNGVPSPGPAGAINDRHRKELHESGLTDATVRDAGLYSASGQSITNLLGWQPTKTKSRSGLVIPFRRADGSLTDYSRVKLDQPRTSKDGKPIKYESPVGKQNHAYFPPGFAGAFATSTEIVVTEGEKKTLAAAQAGFCCIGLVGVWGFQQKRLRNDQGRAYGTRKFIKDLDELKWAEKQVVICFDSDVGDRPDLQLAEFHFAELLKARGARIVVARLPKIKEGKTGIDDFLVHHGEAGPVALQAIIASATEPVMPEINTAMDFAKLLTDDCFTGPTGLKLRYWREEFWRYDGRCYAKYYTAELKTFVLRWLDKRGINAIPRLAAEMVECLGALCVVPFERNMPCWLDGAEHGDGWVVFQNGIYRIGDPTNIQSMPHTARYFSPWALGYNFDPRADCPVWINFLNEVLDGDSERIDLLQRWFGLLLTTDTSFQKLLLLVGPPRAGKGTVARIIGHVLGQDNCAAPTLTGLSNRFALATLLTKSVAIVPDAHIGKFGDSVRIAETLKSIVGEDPQDVDRKYREPLTSIRLPTRFVITCNELAHFLDPSGALSARLSIVPFFNSYLGREDRTLERRLLAELPGIVNWAIVGLARLRAAGCLNAPTKSQALHDNFKRLSSPIATFIEECVETHATFTEPVTDVYSAWIGWCRTNGHERGSVAKLGERLRAVNPSIERSRVRFSDGTFDRHYIYRGLRLTQAGREFISEGRRILDWEKTGNGGHTSSF